MSRLARAHLRPGPGSWFGWDEDGEVLSWRDHGTIAYWDELLDVLRRLAPRGLPRFGSTALLLAACRPDWTLRTPAALTERWLAQKILQAQGSVEPASRAFEQLRRLPESLSERGLARADLAEVVLERLPIRHSPREARRMLRALESQLDPLDLKPQSDAHFEPSALVLELTLLAPALDELDLDAVERRARTGIEQPVAAAPLQLDGPARVRANLERLLDDPVHRGVARVAHDLRAAVHLPRRLGTREELPLGGLSDIAQRGPLDRLLPSELANDDELLVARLANDEALYWERECPPSNPPGQRALLIDCGLRSWGVVRVYSAALALALAADAEPGARLLALRTRGEGVQPVELDSRQGVEDLLAALEPHAHPGAHLSAFAAAVDEQAGASPERVLITSREALAWPECEAAVRAQAAQGSLHVAALGAEGQLRLYEYGPRGRRCLVRAELELERLLGGGREVQGPRALRAGGAFDALPAFLRLDAPPLRSGFPFDPHHAEAHPQHGLLAWTRDGRWMLRESRDCGGWELRRGRPRGTRLRHVWDPEVPRALSVFVDLRSEEASALLVELDSRSVRESTLFLGGAAKHALWAYARWDLLVLTHTRGALAWRIDGEGVRAGEPEFRFELPRDARWLRQRYYMDPRAGAFTLAFDGQRLGAVQVPSAENKASSVFERADAVGYYQLNAQGQLVYESGDAPQLAVERDGLTAVLEVSNSGRFVRMLGNAGREFVLVDLERRRWWSDSVEAHRSRQSLGGLTSIELAGWDASAPQRRFRSVGIDAQGRVWVRKANRTHVRLAVRKGDDGRAALSASLIQRASDPLQLEGPVRWTRFEPRELDLDELPTQFVAELGDGREVWTDARGFLTLVPADRARPALTVCYDCEHFGGWLEDAGPFGSWYLVADATQPAEDTVAGHFRDFTRAGGG